MKDLAPEKFLLESSEKEELHYSYAVIIGRILSQLPAFKWLKKLLPRHIDHDHSEPMSKPSKVFSLPLQFKNEAKYEDCVDILDEYHVQMKDLYMEAFGK